MRAGRCWQALSRDSTLSSFHAKANTPSYYPINTK